MSSLAESNDEWERYVTNNFAQLVETLQPSSLVDHLLTDGLISNEQRAIVNQWGTDEAQARELLDIVRHKGVDRLFRLCKGLKVSRQEHVIRDVMKIPAEHRIWQLQQQEQPVSQPQSNQQVCVSAAVLLGMTVAVV